MFSEHYHHQPYRSQNSHGIQGAAIPPQFMAGGAMESLPIPTSNFSGTRQILTQDYNSYSHDLKPQIDLKLDKNVNKLPNSSLPLMNGSLNQTQHLIPVVDDKRYLQPRINEGTSVAPKILNQPHKSHLCDASSQTNETKSIAPSRQRINKKRKRRDESTKPKNKPFR